MADTAAQVIGGVDCHAETHHACALDQTGRRLGDAQFAATQLGYRQLLSWLQEFGCVAVVGVESTGSYGAGLTRHLCAAGITVREINRPHAQLRHRRGKDDAIDAEGAARTVLSGEVKVEPKDTSGTVESIRQLRVAREGAVKSRSAALCQLDQLLVTAPDELREQLSIRKTLEGKATLCARLRPDVTNLDSTYQAAKVALRSVARRIVMLTEEIKHLDQHLRELVVATAPATTTLMGLGVNHTAQLLVTLGQNHGRIRNEAAFAHLCAANPIPASSGKTNRHRLNPGGDRNANRALHMIIVVRMRYCERTRAYVERRLQEGKSKREIMRCLKRYVAREVFRSLTADLQKLPT
jgi:transposase